MSKLAKPARSLQGREAAAQRGGAERGAGSREGVPPSGADRVDPVSDRVWTVLELIRWTTEHFRERGIETPRLDAECLLAHALGSDRLRLYLEFDKPVVERERALFRSLVRARARARVPVAQLTGRREFWSLPLRVSPHVLIPRPDTETLVAAALDLLPDPVAPARVLDLGTGSGAVALAIAAERPQAVVVATDRSRDALRIAQENAEALGMASRIHFLRGDWAAPLARRFDCVVANPPYLAEAERAGLAPELAHEPDAALFAGPTGLEALERLCREVPALLAPCGGLAFELAPGQTARVQEWLAQAGLATAVRRDLAGRARVVSGRYAQGAGGG
ncbi:MAG TPA: peptide chain release factor N(5)-glutamine methyltransferase [Myxococcota bacterium]|nr:peptide chain release factor N(5)-glutamine methyltransferase [Myxococcota bacterium]